MNSFGKFSILKLCSTDVYRIYSSPEVRPQAFRPENIQSAFDACGIVPFNPRRCEKEWIEDWHHRPDTPQNTGEDAAHNLKTPGNVRQLRIFQEEGENLQGKDSLLSNRQQVAVEKLVKFSEQIATQRDILQIELDRVRAELQEAQAGKAKDKRRLIKKDEMAMAWTREELDKRLEEVKKKDREEQARHQLKERQKEERAAKNAQDEADKLQRAIDKLEKKRQKADDQARKKIEQELKKKEREQAKTVTEQEKKEKALARAHEKRRKAAEKVEKYAEKKKRKALEIAALRERNRGIGGRGGRGGQGSCGRVGGRGLTNHQLTVRTNNHISFLTAVNCKHKLLGIEQPCL